MTPMKKQFDQNFKFDLNTMIKSNAIHYFNDEGRAYKARFLINPVVVSAMSDDCAVDSVNDRIQTAVNEIVEALNELYNAGALVGFLSDPPLYVYNTNIVDLSITYMVLSMALLPMGYKLPDHLAHLEQKDEEHAEV